jgi:hypothetical protein
MSNILKTGVLVTLALAAPQAIMAQSTVFSDDFANGSTINGVSAPTADSTSYDFGSSKTGVETIASADLNFDLSTATGSGFIEAQALFTSDPVTLATPGDYIDLTYTFTDNGSLLAGGTSSEIYTGLYNSGGGNVPVSISGGGSGNAVTFNATSGSSVATGNAAYWQGYISRIAATGGTSESYTRPQQLGAGTTSANQELIGNNFGTGAFNNPAGTQVGGSLASTVVLAAGQYTVDYRLTLSSAGVLTISDNLYSGVGTAGTDLSSQSTVTSSALLTSSFDGLAIGDRNAPTTSVNPDMEINQITVSDDIQSSVPEPNTFVLLGGGLGLFQLAWRRRSRRA